MSSAEEKPAPITFEDEELSDVTLVVDNQDFKIHKMVLALRSNVFKAMFFGNFKESKENRVEIKEVSVDNFRRLLEIIYTGKISDSEKLLKFQFNEKCHYPHPPVDSEWFDNCRAYSCDFWSDTTELLNIADRFNITPMVKDYFESITVTAMRLCKEKTCFKCFNFFVFAILHGMDLSDCENKPNMTDYIHWLRFAYEKPFPDVPNKATLVLLQNLRP